MPPLSCILHATTIAIAGMIEVRGIGIVRMPQVTCVPLAMRVTLGPDVVRMPEPVSYDILGLPLPDHYVDAMTASAPIKIELLLRGVPA